MNEAEAVLRRHSVRRFKPEEIPGKTAEKLRAKIASLNGESGLRLQLVTDRPEAFKNLLTHYGWFKSPRAYVALVGKDGPDLEEKCGYYGEALVLYVRTLGLGTCWIGGTFSRGKTFFEADPGERLVMIIAVGVPEDEGRPHRSKPLEKLTDAPAAPAWFLRGAEFASLAPTALNQQKFRLVQTGERTVRALPGKGAFTKVDLGIVKYHFELGAGRENFDWA